MRAPMNKAVDPTPFKMTRKIAAERRARVVAIVEGLPEADVVAAGNHLSIEVRQKRFGWYLGDHHGDGRLAINCKAPRGGEVVFSRTPRRLLQLNHSASASRLQMELVSRLTQLSAATETSRAMISAPDRIFFAPISECRLASTAGGST